MDPPIGNGRKTGARLSSSRGTEPAVPGRQSLLAVRLMSTRQKARPFERRYPPIVLFLASVEILVLELALNNNIYYNIFLFYIYNTIVRIFDFDSFDLRI